jgi:hypothetical protein
MTRGDSSTINLREVSRLYFTITKRWWRSTWILRLAVFLAAIPAIFWPNSALWWALFVAILTFSAEICSIITVNKKLYAEGILRKLDLRDSFGWAIEDAEVADLLVNLSDRDRKRVDLSESSDDYFASTDGQGWKRAMENLQESSWWSKHLASYMAIIVVALTVVLIVISIIALIVSSRILTGETAIQNVYQVIISVLLLVVSLGLISLVVDYLSFKSSSQECENRATALLRSRDDEKEQAIKLFNEYHLARACSPLIPNWLWKWRRDSLNAAWDQFVQGKR